MRGHPLRGAIGGFLLGLFVACDLALSGAVELDSIVLVIAPIAGIVVGLLLGLWAPFGRNPEKPPTPAETAPAFEPAAWASPADTPAAPADPIPSPPPAPPAEGGTPPV